MDAVGCGKSSKGHGDDACVSSSRHVCHPKSRKEAEMDLAATFASEDDLLLAGIPALTLYAAASDPAGSRAAFDKLRSLHIGFGVAPAENDEVRLDFGGRNYCGSQR